MTKYVLKTNSKSEGTLYYMNIICVTGQPECAMFYRSIEDANRDVQHFKNLLQHTEHDNIRIVDRDGEIIDSTDKDTAKRWNTNV